METGISHALCGEFASATTTAVNGDGVGGIERCDLGVKVCGFDIHVYSTGDVAFAKLFGRAGINELHVFVGDDFGKLLGVYRLKFSVLLTTYERGCGKEKGEEIFHKYEGMSDA